MAEVDVAEFGYYPPSQPQRGVAVEMSPYVGGFAFDTENYADYLKALRFSQRDISRIVCAFLPFSPVLQQNKGNWMLSDEAQTGSYSNRGGWQRISVYIGDVICESIQSGLISSEVMNETLAHETGHMYDAVIRGNDGPTRRKRVLLGMGRIGLRVGGFAKPLGEKINRLSNGLEARRYENCPKEAFANAFRQAYEMPDFISGRVDLTETA